MLTVDKFWSTPLTTAPHLSYTYVQILSAPAHARRIPDQADTADTHAGPSFCKSTFATALPTEAGANSQTGNLSTHRSNAFARNQKRINSSARKRRRRPKHLLNNNFGSTTCRAVAELMRIFRDLNYFSRYSPRMRTNSPFTC
jgi:hypothetical protein